MIQVTDADDRDEQPTAPTGERRIVRTPEATRICGVARTTLLRWEKDPAMRFPQRVELGPLISGWWHDEIIAWLESRRRSPGRNESLAAAAAHPRRRR